MKTFKYRGMTFEVEERFKYIAMDADGEIWLYECEPELCYDYWGSELDKCRKLITVDNWRDSLENI